MEGRVLHLSRIYGTRMRRRIPKGFSSPAQGCEQRATLGNQTERLSNPERVAGILYRTASVAHRGHNPFRVGPLGDYTQGSHALLRQKHYGGQATLG